MPQLRPIWLAPGTPAAFFAGLRRALRRWDRYDAIVILAPPLTTGGDARWIVPHATGVVLVVDGTRSTRRAIDEARRVLRQARAPLLGLVVSNATPVAIVRPGRRGSAG